MWNASLCKTLVVEWDQRSKISGATPEEMKRCEGRSGNLLIGVGLRVGLLHFIPFYLIISSLCSREPLEDEYMDVYQAGRRRMKSTKFPAAYSGHRKCVAGMFSNSSSFLDMPL